MHPRRDTLAPAISGLWLYELLDAWLVISCFFVGMSLVKEAPPLYKKKRFICDHGKYKEE